MGLDLPPFTCVHLNLTPLPLRVDVINGWPLMRNISMNSDDPKGKQKCCTKANKLRNLIGHNKAVKRKSSIDKYHNYGVLMLDEDDDDDDDAAGLVITLTQPLLMKDLLTLST